MSAQLQCVLSAKSISNHADQNSTDRSRYVASCKRKKRLHHLNRCIVSWEEVLSQKVSQRGVHPEIIPFKPVPQGCCNKLLVDLVWSDDCGTPHSHIAISTRPENGKCKTELSLLRPGRNSLLFYLHAGKLWVAALGHAQGEPLKGTGLWPMAIQGLKRTNPADAKDTCTCNFVEHVVCPRNFSVAVPHT